MHISNTLIMRYLYFFENLFKVCRRYGEDMQKVWRRYAKGARQTSKVTPIEIATTSGFTVDNGTNPCSIINSNSIC